MRQQVELGLKTRSAAMWLGGCAVSLLAGCAAAPLQTFDLSAVSGDLAVASKTTRATPHGTLLVANPTATSPLDGDRIVVRVSPDSLAYLKGAQWTQALPRLVQARVIESFDNAHGPQIAARPADAVTADRRLLLDIRRFDMDATTGEAEIEIAAKLVNERSGRIVASEMFANRAPGSAGDGPAAAAALDATLNPVLGQIVRWSSARL